MARFSRCICFLLIACVLVYAGCTQPTDTPDTTSAPAVNVNAKLWNEGDWALYDINRTDTNGEKTHGTLKISSVGNDVIDGAPAHWLEIREDSENGVKITKFLASEVANYNPENGFTFWEDVKRIIIQKDTSQPEEVPAQHLRRFTPHFIENGSTKRFGNIENIDPPTKEVLSEKEFQINETSITASGQKNVQHFVSSVNLGFLNLEDTTASSVEYYMSNQLPFGGIVSVNLSSHTSSVNKLKPDAPPKPPQHFENKMVLKAWGNGAESQIIGTPTEMEVMPFPFLEAARKNASN